MSFLSDLLGGNFSNLGNDLFGSPTAIAETLGAVAAPFALPALAGLAVPAAGEATALAAGGSDVGSILGSLGLTGTTVDPTLLGAASSGVSAPAAGLGSAGGGAADVSTALGFAGDAAVPNAAGAVGGFNPPGVGYFPDFGSASLPTESFLSGNIPGADPLTSGSLSGLTAGDLPQVPGDSLALGGYTGTPSPLTGGGAAEPIPSTLGGTSPDISVAKAGLDQAVPGAGANTGISATLKSMGLSPGILTGLGLTGALGLGGQIVGPKIASAFGLNKPPGSDQLNQLAQQQQQYGGQLEQYLTTGKLPAGAQAAVDQATQNAITTVKAKFASLGLQDSAQEAAAIASIQQNAAAQSFQIAMQMAQQGAQSIGLTEDIYTKLMNATISQDQALSNSISNFASAVGGGLAVGTGQQLAKQALTT